MKSPALAQIAKVLAAPEDQRQRMMDETARELGDYFSKPWNFPELQELAFSIVGLAWADAMEGNVINQIIETKNVALDAVDYVNDRTLRGLMAYWQGKGGRIMSGVLRYDTRQQMPRETMVAAIDMHLDEIATNFWGTLTDLQSQAEEKLRQLPVLRLLELIGQALPTGSTVDGLPLSGTFAHATVDEDDIDGILNTVGRKSTGAWARANGGGKGTGRVAILGSANALSVFGRLGAQYTDLATKIFTQGPQIIGTYKGRPLVTLDNFEDFYGNPVLPDDELWFVGSNAGRLTYYGGPKAAVRQLEAFNLRWETERDAGMLLYGAQAGRIGRIQLS